MEKETYIKQLKKLIKKYHPDLCRDEYLEKLYNEITIKLNEKLEQINAENNPLMKNNDQAYEYYKYGIKYYKNIHPDKFYKRNTDKTYETKTYKEQLVILNNIFISFNSASYYFEKVINEYPKSQWTDDAKNKLKLLKKLYKSYENFNVEENNQIIDSNKFVNEMGLNVM
ncbi:MAG: hypothetical protein LBI28_05490 [Treponema sp.]|jgi:hypothetical protein|nr:hypothetical protein [Treponema sp.]